MLVILSPRDMPEWVVREFCRPAIWFQERKFFLCAREFVADASPHRWRYRLQPWPEDDRQSSPYCIDYSEAYVAERERQFRSGIAAESGRQFLLPLYPLLGFLWSDLKDRLAPLGFNARSLTSISVMFEFGLTLLMGVFVGWLGFWSVPNLLLLAILTVDVLMRFDAVLGHDRRQVGFLEWCFRRAPWTP